MLRVMVTMKTMILVSLTNDFGEYKMRKMKVSFKL